MKRNKSTQNKTFASTVIEVMENRHCHLALLGDGAQ
jgi:hypothetical protein